MRPDRAIDVHTHPMYPLAEVEKTLGFMDKYGIEKIVALGMPKHEDANKRVLKLRKAAPDRVIGGPYIDPRKRGAIGELSRYFDKGCRIVKLFPNLGYYPDDPQFVPFFEKAASLGYGVLSHCGWLGGGGISSTRYARPGRFEELFRRFPDMLFIMAHMGGIDGFVEGIMYTTRTPNVYLDTTPGQSHWVFAHAPEFVRGMPPGRLLLGTDGIFPPWKDGTDGSQEYHTQADMLEKIGWEASAKDVFYNNAAAVIEKYKLLA